MSTTYPMYSKDCAKSTSSKPTYLQAMVMSAAMSVAPCAIAFEGTAHVRPQITTESTIDSPILKSQAIQIKRCEVKAQQNNIDPPTDKVKQCAFNLLSQLTRNAITPDFINPSMDGGIIIEFHKNEVTSLVEIFNDEDVVFMTRSGDSRKAWDLTHENFEDFISDKLFS